MAIMAESQALLGHPLLLAIGNVWHQRHDGYAHQLNVPLMWLGIDIDAISQPDVDTTLLAPFRHWFPWLGANKQALYRFNPADHLPEKNSTNSLKDRVLTATTENGIHVNPNQRILLLAQWRYAGYTFNPISVFIGLTDNHTPDWVMIEVENTFYERKVFPLAKQPDGTFTATAPKHYYVSPFLNLDDVFDFRLSLIDNQLAVTATTLRHDEPVLSAGATLALTQPTPNQLAWALCRYAFWPQLIISAIHLRALQLWFKKAPFHHKANNPHLQTNIYQSTLQ
jgi:DUF1365 family protein